MTEAGFRRLALDLPDAEEGEHMAHPDFRVKGKIFATLGSPGKGVGGWGMVKLRPAQQSEFMKAKPEAFMPAKGAWGIAGATHVHLKSIDRATLKRALLAAWRNAAPKRLVVELGPRDPA